MKYVVCYDVSDDQRRSRLVNVLLNYGARVQESVFVADVSDALCVEMREKAGRVIDSGADLLHVFPMCSACQGKLMALGQAAMPEEREFYVV